MAGNTQADDTLPSIVGRGGANCRITPGPHTQLFGGARHPPPPPREPREPPPPPPPREPPSPAPLLDPPLQAPPPQGASGRQLVGGIVGVQNRGVAPPGGATQGGGGGALHIAPAALHFAPTVLHPTSSPDGSAPCPSNSAPGPDGSAPGPCSRAPRHSNGLRVPLPRVPLPPFAPLACEPGAKPHSLPCVAMPAGRSLTPALPCPRSGAPYHRRSGPNPPCSAPLACNKALCPCG